MAKSMITILFKKIVNKMKCPLDFLVLAHLYKIKKLKHIFNHKQHHPYPSCPCLFTPSLWHHALQMTTYLRNILKKKKKSL